MVFILIEIIYVCVIYSTIKFLKLSIFLYFLCALISVHINHLFSFHSYTCMLKRRSAVSIDHNPYFSCFELFPFDWLNAYNMKIFKWNCIFWLKTLRKKTHLCQRVITTASVLWCIPTFKDNVENRSFVMSNCIISYNVFISYQLQTCWTTFLWKKWLALSSTEIHLGATGTDTNGTNCGKWSIFS